MDLVRAHAKLSTPSLRADPVLHVGRIGSQADWMGAVSGDYERWAKRVMGWARLKVWGPERNSVRPDFDTQLGLRGQLLRAPPRLKPNLRQDRTHWHGTHRDSQEPRASRRYGFTTHGDPLGQGPWSCQPVQAVDDSRAMPGSCSTTLIGLRDALDSSGFTACTRL